MNRITRRYVIMVLSVILSPIASFVMAETNSSSPQWHDVYNQAEQNQSDANPEMIGEDWETTSSRMNRQAAATSNPRSNPNQNRDERTQESQWETTSSRMNRQAAATSNIRSNSNWNRGEQNRNDSDAATRSNAQRL